MNTNTARKPFFITRAAIAAAFVPAFVAAFVGTATPTQAAEPRGQYAPVVRTTSWAEPLSAIDGQTLAQYVADHWADAVMPKV